MILNLFRQDNRWLVRSARPRSTRGSFVYRPLRNQVSIILNGDECHLRIRPVAGSTVYALCHAGCVLHGVMRAQLRAQPQAPLRSPLAPVMHWKSKGEHLFTVKARADEARLELRARKRTLARLIWHSGRPRVTIEASDEEIRDLGLPVILGLITPLLITHPIDK